MADKKIFKISVVGLIILSLVALLTLSLSAVTPSDTTHCKESMQDCSKKNESGANSDIDFETLSGKFFSTVSY